MKDANKKESVQVPTASIIFGVYATVSILAKIIPSVDTPYLDTNVFVNITGAAIDSLIYGGFDYYFQKQKNNQGRYLKKYKKHLIVIAVLGIFAVVAQFF